MSSQGRDNIAGLPQSRMDDAIVLPARPEPIRLSRAETAIIVVDMQNAYSSEGRYLDLAGFDVSGTQDTIANIKRTLAAARAAGMQVIYFQNGFEKDYHEIGAPMSPNWYKSHALKTIRARPELHGQLLVKGTWDHATVDELKPLNNDIVIPRIDTVVSSIQVSTAFGELGAFETWSLWVWPQTSASKPRSVMHFTWNTFAYS
ncbi:hypothetical protein PFICI_03476 [Pestalotiopsis fici W106-1]|uniref:Isochorismatase-like domain-containing protein n=1 Tax=Pestalotiopsis fici (strain W106-1 / CGMCC3.15140) TaxID=1229662 RepID=W3XJM5_PESFW|nr:uncharacterized protein PFICI_03476 [Pestalotiopsis fici W106-1]ETS85451.1 hypothetical protein PFICI_03476 [Pestalotiopsis fici W106-1]